jgi:hypothetical protein
MNKTNYLNINIIKGDFVVDKNYITKMNLYCVIEVGKTLKFKTNVCKSCGK